jgi:hypothetical protein
LSLRPQQSTRLLHRIAGYIRVCSDAEKVPAKSRRYFQMGQKIPDPQGQPNKTHGKHKTDAPILGDVYASVCVSHIAYTAILQRGRNVFGHLQTIAGSSKTENQVFFHALTSYPFMPHSPVS